MKKISSRFELEKPAARSCNKKLGNMIIWLRKTWRKDHNDQILKQGKIISRN
uniref:Uncharacterized protein n=1 Tax=Rhizophora mucronata TaxID=61149 RepID=A0A2P2J111_RHIMU